MLVIRRLAWLGFLLFVPLLGAQATGVDTVDPRDQEDGGKQRHAEEGPAAHWSVCVFVSACKGVSLLRRPGGSKRGQKGGLAYAMGSN